MYRTKLSKRRTFGPVAEPAKMAGPLHSDYGDPGFAGLLNANINSEGRHGLTEALMSIDDCDCTGIDFNRRDLVGLQFALAHPVEIPHDADNAVAVMSDAICLYKTLADSPRLVRRATSGLKNSKHKAEEAINL
jgi:hypothetical protein